MAGLAACLALSPVGTGLAMAAQDNVMTAEPPAEEGFEEAEFAADDDAGLTAGGAEDEDGSLSDEDGDAGEGPSFADDEAGPSADDSSGEWESVADEEEAPDAGQAEAAGEASSAGAEEGEIPLSDDDGGSRAKTGPGQ